MQHERIHFIGIGGIGVSALARFYRSRGFRVSGSDLVRSELTDALRREGMRISIGKHRRSHVPSGTTLVIHTNASQKDNPEIQEAKRRGIPIKTYAEALGSVANEFKGIAIAGAHGKSTTTALAALTLIRGGLDPTVIVGTKLREFTPPAGGSNFRRGHSRYFVYEADEYRASFLNYHPAVAIVTNIDREHLDFYKNIRAIEAAFLKFLTHLKTSGTAILNRDDIRLRKIARALRKTRPDCNIMWFSLRDRSSRALKNALRIPGTHNVSNALAAFTLGRVLHIPKSKILKAIHAYRGSWRRFDYQGAFANAKVFADYAHHPTEIKATLQAAREKFPKSKIWCVFQPHHYERTRGLYPDFVKAFDGCDRLILLDIYEVAGRERTLGRRGAGLAQKHGEITSKLLARAISRRGISAEYLKATELKTHLSRHLKHGDVLLMMGAGTIWDMTKQLLKARF